MSIIFVPAYDPSTQANLTIAQLITTPTSINLFGDDATTDALLKALSENHLPLLAMSHGNPNILYAQNGKVALLSDNIILLSTRSVYAFACHTAAQIGKSAAEKGSIWWGYSYWISCAIDSPSLRLIFMEIFSFIRDNFHIAITSPQPRQTVLNQLKEMCEKAQDEVNYLYSETENPDFNILEVNLTLRHLWDRLRIWVPGADDSERHPDASPDFLF